MGIFTVIQRYVNRSSKPARYFTIFAYPKAMRFAGTVRATGMITSTIKQIIHTMPLVKISSSWLFQWQD